MGAAAAGDAAAPAAEAEPGVAGVAVVIFTRMIPVGAGAGVTERTTDTGVTTVPIGAGVGVTAAGEGALGAQLALRLAMSSASTATEPLETLRGDRGSTIIDRFSERATA